ncbi:MAG: ATP-binding cassette domain-containing protein [Candidatus Omnitrophica bacterium]|nr:ATP-binding cassette domain-containing protein [Candidatus Omnitrophota bacterium]
MSKPYLLEALGLSKHYSVERGWMRSVSGWVHAVSDVSLGIRPNEILGLVGESGSGKSTLGRLLACLEPPTAGSVAFKGKSLENFGPEDWTQLRRQVQMVFQDPSASVDPRLRVWDSVAEPLRVQNLVSRCEQGGRIEEVLRRVGLDPRLARRFPRQLSGGQLQRAGIARALVTHPALVICDEPISALDVSIQAQILNLLADLKHQEQLSYLFIAHDLNVVRWISDRVAVMYLGRIVELAATAELFEKPGHPYTRGLLATQVTETPLKGEIPSPINPPSGCAFRTRCPFAEPLCAEEVPALSQKRIGHPTACHLTDKLPSNSVPGTGA